MLPLQRKSRRKIENMPRKLLLFGNGLGMALNPSKFNLSQAIDAIWQDPEIITPGHKDLISKCLPGEMQYPQGEEELSLVYLAANACSFLRVLQGEEGGVRWLTDIGNNYPDACRKFIKETATQLYCNTETLPDNFIGPLSDFIQETQSHVANLNYDGLLYRPFIERSVCEGYNGHLVDGVLRTGFSENNLERRYDNAFGYYLHLHGSPLFYREGNIVYKSHVDEPELDDERNVRDVVLANVRDKPVFIQRSPILKSYWRYFCDTALPEATEILLVGYSGQDKHVNQLLSAHAKRGVLVRIIEWSGAGEVEARTIFWKKTLKSESLELNQMDNILEFTDW